MFKTVNLDWPWLMMTYTKLNEDEDDLDDLDDDYDKYQG